MLGSGCTIVSASENQNIVNPWSPGYGDTDYIKPFEYFSIEEIRFIHSQMKSLREQIKDIEQTINELETMLQEFEEERDDLLEELETCTDPERREQILQRLEDLDILAEGIIDSINVLRNMINNLRKELRHWNRYLFGEEKYPPKEYDIWRLIPIPTPPQNPIDPSDHEEYALLQEQLFLLSC